jgi:cupin 2 domain-containing protein
VNLFAGPCPEPGREVEEVLARAPGISIRRIVSLDHATPPGTWYDQPEREWVAVLAGRAVVEFDDSRRVALWPGEWLDIPAGARHRVASTAPGRPTVWLAVHFDLDRRPGEA